MYVFAIRRHLDDNFGRAAAGRVCHQFGRMQLVSGIEHASRGDRFAVCTPIRIDDSLCLLKRHLNPVAAVEIGRPDIICAIYITYIGDPATIWTDDGRVLDCGATQYEARLSTFCRHGVNVAEHVEQNGFARGVHSYAYPRALFERQRHFTIGFPGIRHVPFLGARDTRCAQRQSKHAEGE